MLTQPLVSGMNLLSLIGFVLMGVGLSFTRRGKIRVPLGFGLMGAGTALVLAGLYLTPAAAP